MLRESNMDNTRGDPESAVRPRERHARPVLSEVSTACFAAHLILRLTLDIALDAYPVMDS
jgi:hypothetical protein